jgi:hypothetical protein
MTRVALAVSCLLAAASSACLFDDDRDEEAGPSTTPATSATASPTSTPKAPLPSPTFGPPQTFVEDMASDVPVVRWYPMRYEGTADITLLNELFDGSVPLNDEVVYQLETVLEDARGWQLAELDFQRVREPPDSINDPAVDLFIFISSADNFPCESAGTRDTVVIACSVGGEFPIRLPCALIIPDFNRTETAINHEVGHCLRIMHNPAPGVMSELLNNATDWPTKDEIAVVRRLLDPYREDL